MPFFVALIIFLLSAVPAEAEDKFLGLLELPALCAQPCPGSDTPIGLYEAPYVEHPSHVIFRDLYIKKDPLTQDRQNPLWPDTQEIAYEKPAAIVYEKISDIAYKIKIGPYDYWIKNKDAGSFHAYPELLDDKLTYLQNWDSWLWDLPGGKHKYIEHPNGEKEYTPVKITNMKKLRGHWWLQVEILKRSPCAQTTNNFFAKGWIPAYRDDDTRTAWFYARGC